MSKLALRKPFVHHIVTMNAFNPPLTPLPSYSFPHDFFGKASATGAQLKFYGADPRCNEAQKDGTALFEFPVYGDGRLYDKDSKRDVTDTPARVVYLKADLTRCGVMTHVIENDDHTGSGDFRVCDYVAQRAFAA